MQINQKKTIGFLILLALVLILTVAIIITPPIQQDLTYHKFSDSNTIFKISNFMNVASNIPFLIVGFWGITSLKKITIKKVQYLLLMLGIILIGIGSSYYHLTPNNNTLVWDRLPMTLVFMSLFSIIISEYKQKHRLKISITTTHYRN